LVSEGPNGTKVKNKYQNTQNYPNSFWGDQLYHPHQRFFFDPKLSTLEGGFVDGRASTRTEPILVGGF